MADLAEHLATPSQPLPTLVLLGLLFSSHFMRMYAEFVRVLLAAFGLLDALEPNINRPFKLEVFVLFKYPTRSSLVMGPNPILFARPNLEQLLA